MTFGLCCPCPNHLGRFKIQCQLNAALGGVGVGVQASGLVSQLLFGYNVQSRLRTSASHQLDATEA